MSDQMIQAAIEQVKDIVFTLQNNFNKKIRVTCITISNVPHILYEHGMIDGYHFENINRTVGLSNLHLGINKSMEIADKYGEPVVVYIASDQLVSDAYSRETNSRYPIFGFSLNQTSEDMKREGCLAMSDFDSLRSSIVDQFKRFL